MELLLAAFVRELESQISECEASHSVQTGDCTAPGVATIRTDRDDYVRDLRDLRKAMLNPARHSPVSETEGSVPPISTQPILWKLLAFCRPSARFVDPRHLRERLRAFLKVSSGGDQFTDDSSWTQDIWENRNIDQWISSDQSSTVFMEALHTAAPRARHFSLELISHLEKHHPVACMLGGLPPSATNELLPDLTPEAVLEQLTIQVVRGITLSRPLPFVLDNLQAFKEAKDCDDWFDLLQKACEKVPRVSIVLDLALIPSSFHDAILSWPAELHTISKKLSQSSTPSFLNVLLLGPRRLFAGHHALGLTVSFGETAEPERSFLPLRLRKKTRPDPPEVPKASSESHTSWLLDVSDSREGDQANTNVQAFEHVDTTTDPISVQVPTLEQLDSSPDFLSDAESPEECTAPPTSSSPRPYEQKSSSKKRPPDRPDLRADSEGSPKSRYDIRIALVCALPLEADAVRTLFDERWRIEGPMRGKMRSEGDINAYSFGVIGGHPAVLVHMPGMGKGHGAMVATNCRNSFPNLKLALVVGICGGVPFYEGGKHEIVLGDVIVSEGLKQVDFGRQYPGQFMMRESVGDVFGRPPPEIRGLISKLKSRHDRQILRERMTEHLLTLRAVLGKDAEYPGAAKDQVFEGAYIHRHNAPDTCGKCSKTDDRGFHEVCDQARGSSCEDLHCDKAKLVPRRRLEAIIRGAEEADTFPAVHFGYIACADHVMKSGENRDSIAKNTGVIAFEMEGAGVWDMFPCLVIKAVCDYADSHKNKKWQSYAAATAAACTKAFLDEWYM
ncbi:PFS domain-containing protein (phosphorylase superfamily protein) [Colletotrichum sojae]|uniref:PFS domain-containing protein (Phosphorylase superfamily protein) n=1 Tax=Colletotrichum sojae TaxID=2175907 RepID=A0A8H6J8I2_9PEZI|nr:PFS domain-containing protein (phosphorylase superfamily protein) [Colletotrichum sojae]